MDTILVVAPPSVNMDDVLDRYEVKAKPSRMAVTSKLIHDGNPETPIHIFATPQLFDTVIIAKEFPMLYATHFTLSWIAHLCLNFSKNGTIAIEVPNPKANKNNRKITQEYIEENLANATVEMRDHWLTISNIDAQNIPKSVFSVVSKNLAEVQKTFKVDQNNQGGVVAHLEDGPERFLAYSLQGAWNKSFLLEKFIFEKFGGRKVTLTDMGGGSCFIAAELALRGHKINVIEKNPDYLAIGQDIVNRLDISDKVRLTLGDFKNIQENSDVIYFFETLLYAPRNETGEIIKRCAENLNSGGFLLIRELSKDVATKQNNDFDAMFYCDELKDLLVENIGQPEPYNIFTGGGNDWEKARKSVLLLKVDV